MNIGIIQEQINRLHYWDARVLELSCNYFSDEVVMIYEHSDGNVKYHFTGCYKVKFDHVLDYEKCVPSRLLTTGQIPYFLQEIEVGEFKKEENKFYTCKINMFPLYLEILCKNMGISRENTN